MVPSRSLLQRPDVITPLCKFGFESGGCLLELAQRGITSLEPLIERGRLDRVLPVGNPCVVDGGRVLRQIVRPALPGDDVVLGPAADHSLELGELLALPAARAVGLGERRRGVGKLSPRPTNSALSSYTAMACSIRARSTHAACSRRNRAVFRRRICAASGLLLLHRRSGIEDSEAVAAREA